VSGGSLLVNVPGFDQTTQPPGMGRILAGRYRLVAPIARGGMAEVWEGHDEVLSRPVAVKVLQAHLAADGVFLERFRREAVTAARLAHPGIVSTFDTGLDQGTAFIVMELVRGRNLRQWLDSYGRLEPWQSVAVGRQVADALSYAHQAGLVHRDVKPANILLVEDEWGGLRVKVTDFGIAKAGMESGADLTRTGMVLGTPKYLSPEQIRGADPDARADLYSLGVVMYETLVGAPPYVGETDMATALAHLGDKVPKPSSSVRGIPSGLDRVVCDLLAKNPDRRVPSAIELRRRLDALGPLGPTGPGRPPSRHHRRRADGRAPVPPAPYPVPYPYPVTATGPYPGVDPRARAAPAPGAPAGPPAPYPGRPSAPAGPAGGPPAAGPSGAGQPGGGPAGGPHASGPPGAGPAGGTAVGAGPGVAGAATAAAAAPTTAIATDGGAPTTAVPNGFAGTPPPPPPPPGRSPAGAPSTGPSAQPAPVGVAIGPAGASPGAEMGATRVIPQAGGSGTDQFEPAVAPPHGSRRRTERNIGLVVLGLVLIGAMVAASLLTSGGGKHNAGAGGGSGTVAGSGPAISGVSVYLPVLHHTLDNAARTSLTIDGNPATFWSTDQYNSRTFGNLYPGIGLVIQLAAPTKVHTLTVTSATQGWSASTYVSSTVVPTGQPVSAWGTPTDSKSTIAGDATFNLAGHEGRYILLWITYLGVSRSAQVAELAVH
jgi:eukaryotic-like serine/threonine-protein kinase